jgi:hypothetical protein
MCKLLALAGAVLAASILFSAQALPLAPPQLGVGAYRATSGHRVTVSDHCLQNLAAATLSAETRLSPVV